MALHWIHADLAEFTRRGIMYFHSESEMADSLQCKIYRITEQMGSIRDHMHNYFQTWYVTKGEFIHTIHGRKYHMIKGNIFVIPPYAVHRVDWIPGRKAEVIGCEFLPSFVNERLEATEEGDLPFDLAFIAPFLTEEERVLPKMTLTRAADQTVSELLAEMLAEYAARAPGFEMLLKANLLKLLTILVREHADNGEKSVNTVMDRHREAMVEAIRYIEANYDQSLRLEELCTMTMLSRTLFCDLFKRVAGRTFSRYVTELRIRAAMELLTQPSATVTDVCFKVGFNELPYFCRIFKKHTGMSPAYYKKNACLC
ncbi:AraC family transcriptional regulator [Paenibacillus sp. J5C_2022]|uniref:AraC family transcriptional regulator n=1 Tax=Paenibacillus sp. J5C2022 TaxID=2977129 RepID=UPI0021D1F5CD|nr:AraC family transcriptional regulator [Paenibacillus sp. J5C2022]MCU6710256.1 AraC family transcriptional regulator [Paenibacillus sp. J5C2022]